MHRECFECDISQMKKISAFMQLGREKEGQLINLAGDYLKTCDMSKSNPEIMGEIWGLMIDVVGTDNPYKEIKSYYNQLVLSMSDMIRGLIDQSGRRLECGLKLAIAGNLIDFAARHRFDENTFKELIQDIAETEIAIDHSKQLFQAVKSSRTLLYLGDNCGEIVLDKYFISLLKEYNKELYVYYGVRGKPIVNDVTADDASEAGMQEVAEVISNGDGSLGTVLHRTSPHFQKIFRTADVVICKGQGNYEGLQDCGKENLFFLFMAKCGIVADPLGVKKMSVVCMKKGGIGERREYDS
ncbi:DUF89 family protein [Lachnospiraceae bacterium MD308]|nr:DUF89 family protein [Lachnospiraceae bacterium MD308]MCI8579623.1 DUF89 family protein [Dorea sp.]